jgi:hypothetical protein
VSAEWPASLAERLAERAAFAERVPGADELPAPVRTPTLPDVRPALTPAVPERRERRRRTRVALAVVPVVVVVTGTTLAIQNVPFGSHPRDEARATPTVTVSAAPTPSASEASPTGKASPSPGKSKASDKGKDSDGGGGSAGGSSGAQDGSGSSGSGSGSGSSSASGGSNDSDSGSDSGSSDSGDSSSASSGSSAGSPPPALKSYRLDYTNSCVGACDMPIKVSWTAVSRATRYDIHYTNKGSSFTAKNVDTVYSTGNTSYTITGPYSGDQICITVRAANKYGASAWAETWCDEVPY